MWPSNSWLLHLPIIPTRGRDGATNKQPCLNHSQFILPQLLSYPVTGRPTDHSSRSAGGANSQIRMGHYQPYNGQTDRRPETVFYFPTYVITRTSIVIYCIVSIKSVQGLAPSPRLHEPANLSSATGWPQPLAHNTFHAQSSAVHAEFYSDYIPVKYWGKSLARVKQTLKPV